MAWLGAAGVAAAWRGLTRRGRAGVARRGVARRGAAWQAWLGSARLGVAWCGWAGRGREMQDILIEVHPVTGIKHLVAVHKGSGQWRCLDCDAKSEDEITSAHGGTDSASTVHCV